MIYKLLSSREEANYLIGIIQPVEDRTNVLTHNCKTGNCTLPSDNGASFSSVAVSHKCENITSRLQWTNQDEFPWVHLDDLSLEVTTLIGIKTDVYDGSPITDDILEIRMITRPNSLFGAKKISAWKCSLYPVVNTYSVNISNTIMREILLKSAPMRRIYLPPDRDYLYGAAHEYRAATSSTLRNGTLQSLQ